jgi:hypothetical protein
MKSGVEINSVVPHLKKIPAGTGELPIGERAMHNAGDLRLGRKACNKTCRGKILAPLNKLVFAASPLSNSDWGDIVESICNNAAGCRRVCLFQYSDMRRAVGRWC